MRQGSSGARIIIRADDVVKLEGVRTRNRVREQGIWLRRFDASLALPAVNAVHADGYTMEKLIQRPLPRTEAAILDLCGQILDQLKDKVWQLKTGVRSFVGESLVRGEGVSDWDHCRYVARLTRDVKLQDLKSTLLRRFRKIDPIKLRVGTTHGDSIIDNVMWRAQGSSLSKNPLELVLIDPIPATSALPDWQAVDVGRVIQSAVGYELIRYPDGPHEAINVRTAVDHVLNEWLDDEFTLQDAQAAVYFAVIHMLRGIRTARIFAPDTVSEMIVRTYELMDEVDRWMR